MKKGLCILILGCLATVVWAGEGHKCTASAQACLDKYVSHLASTAWDGINVEGLGSESGAVSVYEVEKGSPGEQAGVKQGDTLIAMAGKTLAGMSGEDLEATMKTIKIGDKVPFVVERDGKKQTIHVTMVAVPDSTIATWVGKHMVKHHANRDANI